MVEWQKGEVLWESNFSFALKYAL